MVGRISSVSRRALFVTGATAMVAGGIAFRYPRQPQAFHSIDITGASYARSFSLLDHTGRLRTLEEFRSRIVAVFFGFTQCPDVCPTTLLEMNRVKQLLGRDGDKLQVLFITVDPERDTPQVLQAYMANFGRHHLALVPSVEQLPEVAKEFRIYYAKVPGQTSTSYVMEHSAVTYVFDTAGRVRLLARYGLEPERLAADVRRLLAQA